MLEPQTTLNCKGRLLDVSQPIVMGILNVTPDSFYDGGKYKESVNVLQQVERMLTEGAQIIDIGGMSSRPGATIISVEEELNRVIPILDIITKEFPDCLISIDTVRSKVAKEAVQHGASIVNDISAGQFDEDLYQTVADSEVPYVLMHMQGQPKTMQLKPNYEDVTLEVLDFFIQEIGILRKLGIKDIIVDPGFGFGKSITHNFELLKKMHIFKMLDVPILAGISRKSMIYKTLSITPEEALNGTTAMNLVALQQGASILRVHDVKEAVETIKLFQMIN